MEQTAILYPLVAMLLLVMVVWFLMLIRRVRFFAAHPISPEQMRSPEAVRAALPPPAQYAAENFRNLFEVPVLFYALVLLVFHVGMVDLWSLGLAWVFVAFRVVHSVIHCSYNHVPHRFAAYGVACLALWIMLLRTVFLLATG